MDSANNTPLDIQVPFLTALAKKRNQTVSIADVIATAFVEEPAFGIIELALIHVQPDGQVYGTSCVINPEVVIADDIAARTGITNAIVETQPTWASFADTLNTIAERDIILGYNTKRFDIPAINSQNRRYGFPEMDIRNQGDIYAAICDTQGFRKGTLEALAERYGVLMPGGLQHALPAAIQLALVADAFIAEHGTAKLFNIVPVVSPRKGEKEPTQVELVCDAIVRHGEYNPARIAEETEMTIAQVESSADALYRSHAFDGAVFARPVVQEWLDLELPEAMRVCWTSTEANGRLKPLMEHLQSHGAGKELTYLQLRVGVTRHKRAA